jgi:putative MATE family efflux protein
LTLVVDTAMCGRLPDSEAALTALGFATQLVFLLLVLMMGLTVGTVALVARAHGAGDTERVGHLVTQSTQMTAILGVGLGAIGFAVAEIMLRVLGASPEIAELGAAYLRPLMVGSAFFYLMVLYGALCRGVGNTRLPFFVALASNGLNIALNYGLILGNLGLPALGVEGAGIGTAISHVFNVVVIVSVLRRGTVRGLIVRLRPERIDRRLAGEVLQIGFPAAVDMVILNAAFLSIIGMLGRIDDLAVAAHGVGLRIQALAFVPGLAVSQATAALVGQALGAGDVERSRQITRASIALCVGIMTTLAAAIVIAASPIVGLFDVKAGSPLALYAVEWMRLLGYGMPIVGVHIALIGLLQGAGATGTSLRINALGTLAFQIPLSAIFAFPLGLGATGLWLSFPLSFAVKAALAYRAYRAGRWARTGKSLRG